ncbi:MAG: TolC family protein [Deltaproteobacteria bacterium]|nr:TolC family protein [Deltaproteobacteria bacterium]
MKTVDYKWGSLSVLLSVVLILIGIWGTANGETAVGKLHEKNLLNLTLQDCIDIAFQKSLVRGVSQTSIQIAEAQRNQALSARWPQLKFSMTAMRWDESPNFVFPSQPLSLGAAAQPFAEAIAATQLAKLGITPDSVGLAAYNNYLGAATADALNNLDAAKMPEYNVKLMDRDLLSSTLSLIYPLYTGGKISALTKQAKIGVEVSREEARRTDLQIVKDVKQYYYGHILAKKIHQLGRDTLERFEATEALTESLYRNGSGRVKKTDYLRTKMITAALRSAIEVMKSGEELSKSALGNAMGLSWDTPIGLAETDIPFHPYSADLSTLVEKAGRTNPQMMQVRLGLQAMEEKITEAKAGHLPIVAFIGDYTHLDSSYMGGIMTDENKNSWRIGLSLELPIFNGFRTKSEVREARHRLEKLQKENLLLKEGVALMVKNAFLQIARSQGQVISMKEALDLAVENRELNVRAYQQEMVETQDVIEAQLMEFVMHGQYLKALYDFQTNSGELEFIIGKSICENQ